MKVKICGMKHATNIASVATLQPDYLGFIFYQKSPRAISHLSAELIRYVPADIKTVGVFVNEDVAVIQDKIIEYRLKAVQLHGNESVDDSRTLKATGVEVIKAFGIDADFDFSKLEKYLDAVDYFLFDTQSPNYGGTGTTFDWDLLKKYMYHKPYFLSGGIDVGHLDVLKKITDPRCIAIDLNSKFEVEPGLKDVDKLNKMITEIRLLSKNLINENEL